MISLTDKQQLVLESTLKNPKKYNISVGAVRSGKTYLDYFRIPYRLHNLSESDNVVFIGNTLSTIERNIITPLRNIWGSAMVSPVSGGKATLFGKRVYLLGAEKSSGGEKIQGMSISYAYGDEITTWNEEVFRMLESRLDKDYSIFDGTCNPDSPTHWFKKFLDSDADISVSHFRIDDNPALSEKFVKGLKKEYMGTVYYDRYILGKWRSSDGIIYRSFADNPKKFIIPMREIPKNEIIMADIGVDFGGNGSAHAFNLTGYTANYGKIITLDEYYQKKIISPTELQNDFVSFVKRALENYPHVYDIYCDSAEQVLIKGLKNVCASRNIAVNIKNASKKKISDRISFYLSLFSQGKYFISDKCTHTIDAFASAEYDEKGGRKDDGTSNIDSLDAQEYSTEHRMNDILERLFF